jgi:hypothetical protein
MESFLPWKCKNYYLLLCVCVRAHVHFLVNEVKVTNFCRHHPSKKFTVFSHFNIVDFS